MTIKFSVLLALGAAFVAAPVVHADLLGAFNFDILPSGTAASAFNTPAISFHNAKFAPTLDSFGDPIVGSDHWQIDTAFDSLLVVSNPLDFGRGPAPSGINALNALNQEVLITFDRSYDLTAFSVTLDNDPFGFLSSIYFLNGSNSIIGTLAADERIPGYIANGVALAGVSGIVLPGLAMYDNLSISVVPEPSTTALVGCLGALGAVIIRRRRSVAKLIGIKK